MSIRAEGTFEITVVQEPPYESADGVTLARASLSKKFSGTLEGSSTVQMLGAHTTVAGSAGYVALERLVGRVGTRAGSFVLQHNGWMQSGETHLTVTVVPDSGTGELKGLSGSMSIRIVDGQHHYAFDYVLPRD
ncbi:MAG TPA: DUF3224 domain-containing protein [Polyangiales bacterium]|nr:DUF3224 domain-containing protein [Polyangiales bacterium]